MPIALTRSSTERVDTRHARKPPGQPRRGLSRPGAAVPGTLESSCSCAALGGAARPPRHGSPRCRHGSHCSDSLLPIVALVWVNSLAGSAIDSHPQPERCVILLKYSANVLVPRYRCLLVLRVIQRTHSIVRMWDIGPWFGGWSHGATGLRGFERRGTPAVGGDRGRPQPAAQARRAGAHRARLGGSALAAAGGAQHRCQPADRVALAATLCRERG
jgi:hypothetical protein